MSKYFKESEFTKSQTADKLKINNQPNLEVKKSINDLIDFLDPYRQEWNKPFIITSGYRCEALNKAVKGSKTSNHLYLKGSCAVDFQTENITKFYYWFLRKLLDNKIKFDELFLECGNTKWIHFALYGQNKQQRLKYGLLFL